MVIKNKELEELAEIIKKNKKIVLLPHQGADGDCLGSMMALHLALKKLQKESLVVLDEHISDSYSFLKEISDFSLPDKLPEAELYVVLDVSSPSRIVFGKELLSEKEKGKKVIILDHHKNSEPEKLAQFYYINEDSSSNSEIVYEIIKNLGVKIDKNIATCLLTGLESDTTSFQNQNTNARSFKIASELVSKGARMKTIIRNAILGTPFAELKIRGLVLERLVVNKRYKIAFTYLKYEDFIKFDLSKNATSGLTNILNVMSNVNIIFFIYEEKNGILKISMRSRKDNIDLSLFAKIFGGGGHKGASGFVTKGKILESIGGISII